MSDMGTRLDRQEIFTEQATIEEGSCQHQFAERSAAGLNGVVSVDMGGRGRKIQQRGELRARSKAELSSRVEAISAFMDGDVHTLEVSDGRLFEDVRIDSFTVGGERTSGAGVVAEYEIVYRQLA